MARRYQVQKLSDYPWVWVRIECRYCTRSGRYRLARLAAKYGPETDLDRVLFELAADCGHWSRKPQKYAKGCGVHFPDLERPFPPPPDLPPRMMKPTLVKTDRDEPEREGWAERQIRKVQGS